MNEMADAPPGFDGCPGNVNIQGKYIPDVKIRRLSME
jgi:hypothetical protein